MTHSAFPARAINSSLPKVIVVAGLPLMREALRLILEETKQVAVVAHGANAGEAYSLYCQHRPDVLVLDVQAPMVSGPDVVRHIRSSNPDARILVMASGASEILVSRLLAAGAMGYLNVGCAVEELARAVLTLANGKRYVDPVFAAELAYRSMSPTPDNPLGQLSQREFEVFQRLAHGDTVAEIAQRLYISAKTVSSHQTSIVRKLRVRNTAELVRLAIRCGILEP